MTSLLTFLLTLNVVKRILVPVYGTEMNYVEPIDLVDYSLPEIIVTNPVTESIDTEISLSNSMIKVSIRSVKCFDIRINAYFEDTFLVSRTFFDKRYQHEICQEGNGKIDNVVLFKLPDSLGYFDEQNMDNPTNYFVNKVEVYISFLLHTGEVYHDEHKVIPIASPWFRKPRPRYCRSWYLHLHSLLKWRYIPTCKLSYDPNLFSTVVGLPAKDIGFTRKLDPMNWPTHAPPHVSNVFESDST